MRNLMLSTCLLKRYLANPRNHFGQTRGISSSPPRKVDQLFTRVFYENINSYIRHRDEYLIFARIIDFPSMNFFLFDLFSKRNRQSETMFPYNFFLVSPIIFESSSSSRKDTNRFWNEFETRLDVKSTFPPPFPPRLFRLYRDKTSKCEQRGGGNESQFQELVTWLRERTGIR